MPNIEFGLEAKISKLTRGSHLCWAEGHKKWRDFSSRGASEFDSDISFIYLMHIYPEKHSYLSDPRELPLTVRDMEDGTQLNWDILDDRPLE